MSTPLRWSKINELPLGPANFKQALVVMFKILLSQVFFKQITAQVSQNIYDTVTGNYLLIPQGTRAIGVYDSQVSYGQARVLMAWTRLISKLELWGKLKV